MTREEWMNQYQQVFLPEEKSTNFKDTKREDRGERCGDCIFFGEEGCAIYRKEAKFGCKSTPACSDFIPKKRFKNSFLELNP